MAFWGIDRISRNFSCIPRFSTDLHCIRASKNAGIRTTVSPPQSSCKILCSLSDTIYTCWQTDLPHQTSVSVPKPTHPRPKCEQSDPRCKVCIGYIATILESASKNTGKTLGGLLKPLESSIKTCKPYADCVHGSMTIGGELACVGYGDAPCIAICDCMRRSGCVWCNLPAAGLRRMAGDSWWPTLGVWRGLRFERR